MGHECEIIPDAPPLDFGLPEAPLSAPDLARLESCPARWCAAKSERVSVNEL